MVETKTSNQQHGVLSKETVNEMLGQRGVGHTVERVIRIVK